MNCEDKNSFPGYIYFRDNGMDYKIGLTNNLVVRGKAYKTENPRDTVVDFFVVETYAEAEAIEAEMKKAARAEGLCSFDNSDEWLKRPDDADTAIIINAKLFWRRFVLKYAKKTVDEWDASGEMIPFAYANYLKRRAIAELEATVERLEASIKGHKGAHAKLRHDLEDLERENKELREHSDLNKTNTETLIPHSFDTPWCTDDSDC